MSRESIIKISGLTKKYGNFTAVDHLDLSIGKGEVFGLLGPNGAGKSTTILIMMGLTEPDEGSVSICGINPLRNPVEVKRKVGYLPEDVGFYDRYTGVESLTFTAMLNGLGKTDARKKAEAMISKVGLQEHAGKRVAAYSRGMRQRLGLADALIKDPEVIILDEPIMGIDPSGIREFLEMIVELSRKEGITVLFSSHQLYQVQQVCDRVGLFVDGKLIASGDMQELARELSGNQPYQIEAGISSGEKDAGTERQKVLDLITGISGTETVEFRNDRFYISATKDITATLSARLSENGYTPVHLVKKEFGLDDIYYQFFKDVQSNG